MKKNYIKDKDLKKAESIAHSIIKNNSHIPELYSLAKSYLHVRYTEANRLKQKEKLRREKRAIKKQEKLLNEQSPR